MSKGSSFIERTLRDLADAFERAGLADTTATHPGLLQQLDPRAKLCGLMLLLLASAASRHIAVTAALLAFALLLALLSGWELARNVARLLLGILFFTAIMAFPAIFLTPGTACAHVPWIGWPITLQGLRGASHLILRAGTTATFALLLVLSTPHQHLLRALHSFKIPGELTVILGMTHRYIFLLLETAEDLFHARKARTIAIPGWRQRATLAASGVGALFSKSFALSSEVFLAMQARGFRGEARTLDDPRMQPRDWLALAGFLCIAALAFWKGLA